MGEHVAWIAYDHGVRPDVEHLPFAYCARFAVALKQPDHHGLPSGDEFAQLNSIEDQLVANIPEQTGIQLGRVTTNGKRYFTFLTSLDEAAVESIADKVAARSGYEILLAYEADPERRCYWNELFPTEDDWQVIQDMRVEESLRKEGDPLTTPRPIEHWAYFETPADRERFVALIREKFDDIELYETPDSDRGVYTARLTHTGLPDYRSMNSFTILLNRSAGESGGDYDGWETEVCKE